MSTFDRLSTEHRESERSFDSFMAIDRGSNRTIYLLGEFGIFRKFPEFLLLVGIVPHGLTFRTFNNIVGLNEGCKKRKALLDVQKAIIAIHEGADHLHFVSGPSQVDVVTERNNFLVPGNPPGQNIRGGLLDCHFLVVSVYGFLFVDQKWPC